MVSLQGIRRSMTLLEPLAEEIARIDLALVKLADSYQSSSGKKKEKESLASLLNHASRALTPEDFWKSAQEAGVRFDLRQR